ncbi:Terpene synthase 5 [Euphorbia peplus]|nr:Terpene synthase 5 [Euphorbia peplus]
MEAGNVTNGYNYLTSIFIIGMKNMGMEEILWVRNEPKIALGAKLYIRFLNDISGLQKDETAREDFSKTIDYYKLEYDVSKEEAIEAILKILENKWKEINEDFLKPTTLPKILLKYTLNYV